MLNVFVLLCCCIGTAFFFGSVISNLALFSCISEAVRENAGCDVVIWLNGAVKGGVDSSL